MHVSGRLPGGGLFLVGNNSSGVRKSHLIELYRAERRDSVEDTTAPFASHINVNQAVIRVQEGDMESYAFIIQHFQRKLYLYCYYLLKNQEEAEDATQDIFIKGLDRIRQFSPTVSFSAWIYKIAHHHCIDLMKKRNKSLTWFLHLRKEPTEFNASRYTDYIHELLERLNTVERKILLLRALEDYSFEEIGIIMGLKSAAVRKKYERLRKKMRNEEGGAALERHVYQHGGERI
ncbi:sigma-70 family RNA polymerase sigma factor [Paenibacillus sp. T1]|uniref:Sigma-70 family RNA polymerase sigma factor n=2 Tax=Paenibacillus glycinis TaxID=2697035 RepID=A0ABW9XNC5_9BACL|nr:sigma-70 family RNA polymerase sigma factor [Paenibacillus glycinis]